MPTDTVRFGLSNVHYAVYNDSSYETPVSLPGAVNLTMSPEGDSSTFYADNRAYFVTETNNGYTGTIEVAAATDEFLKTVLGYKDDSTSGVLYETTEAQPASVALLFEINGNAEQQRFCLYNVTFSRLDTEANTTSESTEPDTVTLNWTAIGRTFTVDGSDENVVRSQCTNSGETHTAYDSFFEKVVIPGQSVE